MSDLQADDAVDVETVLEAGVADVPSTGPTALAAKRLGIGAWIALAWLAVLGLAALLATVLPLTKPGVSNLQLTNLGPFRDAGHILGANNAGQDLLARVLYGARTSLSISLSAIFIGIVVGGFLGLLAGYYRGWVDTVITGLSDSILAFPALILSLALVAFLKGGSADNSSGKGLSGQVVLIIALGLVAIPILARITRASTMQWSQREFVLAAKAQGATTRRILFREMLPNVLPATMSLALLSIAVAIIAEGALSILGAGLDPSPTTMSWGSLINDNYSRLQSQPWPVFVPSIAMFLTVFALNYLGDAVRERFDVRESAL
jgi:peptide/nickel transport system permease protein